MKNKFIVLFLVAIVLVSTYQAPAFAHRSGCHRWHSCPSDTGSYTCGDTGQCSQCPDNQYCKASSPITSSTVTYTNPSQSPSSSTTSQNTIPTPTPTPPTPTPPIPEPIPMPLKIPHWVQSLFNLHNQGKISDNDLNSALKFIIQRGVIKAS